MSFSERRVGYLGTPGPFLAKITNHLDPSHMGRLEVVLKKGIENKDDDKGQTYIVSYLSPFYGVMNQKFEGPNAGDWNDVQKSYGWWAVPPDVGTTVMVIFLDGDPNQGYWIGCVQDDFANHMVPGIAASKQILVTQEQRQKYGTDYLPVAEFHVKSQKIESANVHKYAKPVHPFADRLLAQGLLLDTIRGITSSSARREIPSSVFGISTPGPLDTSPGARTGTVGYEQKRQIPVSRLGGSSFVMDDGDIKGQNELVRIRTRTGHQILLHNSQDLIYIANSKGTSWIELTSNGKVDIYSADSVSIHSENDFNFRADRDINLEAGRNFNIRTVGNMETNVTGQYFLIVDDSAKISIKNTKDETVGQTSKLTITEDYNLSVSKDIKISAESDIDIYSGNVIREMAAGDINVKAGGDYIESTEGVIHMNGPAAAAAVQALTAEVPPTLPLFSLPNRSKDAGWANNNWYKTDDIQSIMQRVPTHEPWDQHENINPERFSPEATDISLVSRETSGVKPNSASNVQRSANSPTIQAGVCNPKFAKDINSSSAVAGIDALKAAAKELGLTSPYAVAALLGICGGESRWKAVKENFNYTASRLLEVFPSIFKGRKDLAQQYAGNPNNSLPEFLYGYQTAKGKGLGNTQAGDGSKFIGRGFIQLTGRSNYAKYSKLMFSNGLVGSETALIDNPDLLLDNTVAAQVSVLYLIDRVKLPQTDPGYFEAASRAVGYNTPDIYLTKRGFYECFYAQLSGSIVGTGTGGIVTDSQGNPVSSGSSNTE